MRTGFTLYWLHPFMTRRAVSGRLASAKCCASWSRMDSQVLFSSSTTCRCTRKTRRKTHGGEMKEGEGRGRWTWMDGWMVSKQKGKKRDQSTHTRTRGARSVSVDKDQGVHRRIIALLIRALSLSSVRPLAARRAGKVFPLQSAARNPLYKKTSWSSSSTRGHHE